MKKSLFLTGAGMAIPWGGPLSDDITSVLLCKIDALNALSESITHNSNTPNFEELIYAVELLFQHNYSQKYAESNGKHFSLPSVFDVTQNLKKALEPHIKDYGKEERVFYADLFTAAIRVVNSIIKEYSYNISEKVSLNHKLDEFLSHTHSTHSIRCYTTNYDRLFIEATKTYNFFDGFSNEQEDSMGRQFREQNLLRVISDRHCNCFYNLHGSIYWDVPYVEDKQLAIFDEGFSSIELNYPNRQQLVTANPKEFQLVSPIITGYNKTQRTNLEPFNVFFNSFLQDSFESDIWFIIGYSFSDPHINNTLSTAYNNREGNSPRIIWVSMEKECKTEIDLPFKFAEFRELFRLPPYSETCYKNPAYYFFHSSDRSVYLYFGGLESFLTDKIWQQII